jgi:hypothetical protein
LGAVAVVAIALSAMTASSQEFGGGEPANRALRVTSLLKKPVVRRELSLESDQIDALIRIEVDQLHLYSSGLGQLNQKTIEERRIAHEEFKRQLGELEKRAIGVLLPVQRERFEQLLVQSIIRATDSTAGLTHPAMVDRLAITEMQLESVRTKAGEAQQKLNERMKELMAEISKAKQQAQAEVLTALTEEQRKQYVELTGNLFDPSTQP